jgi:hypothetical protein
MRLSRQAATWRRAAARTLRARRLLVVTSLGLGLLVAVGPAAPAEDASAKKGTVRHANHADTSPPLRDIKPKPFGRDHKVRPEHEPPSAPTGGAADPAVQSSTAGASPAVAPLSSFDGVGAGFTGPQGTFAVQYAPPDTDGDVGLSNYVQIVNVGLAVFDKSGKVLYGPVPSNTLFQGFGGGCETNNDGDATVKYDRLADRWLISQFSVSTQPYLQCVAVSTTGDPTGTYYRYSFAMSNFPDYPKPGVWADAYYTTFNMFSGSQFVGAEICAYNRAGLLTGPDLASAIQVCASPSGAASLVPADMDGPTPPPSGAPNYLLGYGTNSLKLWQFHVDWANPGSPLLSAPTTIAVAPFTATCAGGCIPQSGTTQKIDSLSDRLMYRLAYRNLGGIERLVVSHAVNPGNGTSGVRWYELWNPNGTPTVHQQGTYAPTSSYRWMSSAAMDGSGQIAVGYSLSSGTMHPAIGYAAHLSTDGLGLLGTETVLMAGTGSQTTALARWGDYSRMSVDPSDDCTFWYTTEYLVGNGTWNWHTRIGSFRLPNCAATVPADFGVSVSPSNQTVAQGTQAAYSVAVSPTSTYSGTVNLTSTAGAVSPTALTFGPAPGGPQTAALTIDTAGLSGPMTITVTAADASGTPTHTASASLNVTPPTTGDFTVSASPTSRQVNGGRSTSYAITVASQNGFAGTVNLTAAANDPDRVSAAVSPGSVTLTSGGSATSTLTAKASASGTYTITVTATYASTGLSHTVTVTLRRK